MKARLTSLLLCAVMLLGMIPTTALAADHSGGVSTLAVGDWDYQIAFRQSATEYTETGVNLVDADGDRIGYQGATVDGAVFDLEGMADGVPAANMASGYGLVHFTHEGTEYLFSHATWGPSGTTINPMDPITYEQVETNAEDGVYLHYIVLDSQSLPVELYLEDNGRETEIQAGSGGGTLTAGEIDNFKAQETLGQQSAVYYFDRAELRQTGGGDLRIEISSIYSAAGFYYAELPGSSNTMDTFLASGWEIALVYQPGVSLTVNVALESGAGNLNLIDGVSVTDIGGGDSTFAVTYQAPRGGYRDVTFTIGSGANLDLVETTTGQGSTLFSSARDGYQYKTYTLTLTGEGENRTVNATFTGVNNDNRVLDFNHYGDYRENYHNHYFEIESTRVTDANFADGLWDIRGNSVRVRLYFGYDTYSRFVYVPNVVSVNGTFINIPWPGVNYSTTSNQAGSGPWTTEIRDTANNRQANVSVTYNYRWDSMNNRISGASYMDISFTNISNNLKIDFINLANANTSSFRETRLTAMGDGVEQMYYGSTSNNSTYNWGEPIPNGYGWNYQPGNPSNTAMWVDVLWDHYVTQFRLRTPPSSANGSWTDGQFQPAVDLGHGPGDQAANDRWYGDKAYRFGGQGYNYNNSPLMTAHQQADVQTAPIDFYLRYDTDGERGGGTLREEVGANFAEDGGPVIAANYVPNTPANSVFMGWSLYPAGHAGGRGTIFQSGERLARGVVDADPSVVVYDEEQVGQAYITLYPVFVDTSASNEFTTYMVRIHYGGSEALFTGSGIIGSVLTRDNVLLIPSVERYVEGLLDSNYVLDGVQSDSVVPVAGSGLTSFDLYFNSTEAVTVTFSSPYGFAGGTGTADTRELMGTPNTGLTGGSIPVPYDQDGYTFVGWSTDQEAAIGSAITTENFRFPNAPLTYYAIYAPDVTLSFHAWSPNGGWERTPRVVTVGAGQSIREAGQDASTAVSGLETTYPGYTFTGWALGGPYGTTVYSSEQIQTLTDFSGGTTFYAVYQAATNAVVILDGNGGTFGGSGNTLRLEGQTVGSVVTPSGSQIPTRTTGSWVFVGWSQDDSDVTGSMSITVGPGTTTYHALWLQTSLAVEVNDEDLTYNGQAQRPGLTVRWNDQILADEDYEATFDHNLDAGTGTVTVVTDEGYRGFATFEIGRKSISGVRVDGINASYPYTGSQIIPANIVVHDNERDADLELGVDYTLTYGDNRNVNGVAGSTGGTVTITGIGNYEGSLRRTFNITIADGNISVAPILDQLYNGGNRPAALEGYQLVVYDQNRRMLDASEYEATWPTSWELGPQTVTVRGVGNYQGKTAQVTFNVTAASTNFLVDVTPPEAAVGTVAEPTITVTAAGSSGALRENTDYTLTYERYNGANGQWVAVSGTDMTGAAAQAGIYRITATGVSTTVYQGVVGYGIFVRTQAPTDTDGLTVSLTGNQSTVIPYDGADHSDLLSESNLSVVVTDGGSSSVSYTIESVTYNGTTLESPYTNRMVNAGYYVVTVRGTDSNSSLSGTLTLYITPRNLSDAAIEFRQVDDTPFDSAEYTGEAIAHSFALWDTGLASSVGDSGTLQLTERTRSSDNGGIDVNGDADYGNNTNGDYYILPHNHGSHVDADSYVVTVSGSGNYTGAKTFTFTITPKTITVGTAGEDIQLTYGYSSSDWEPAVSALETAAQTQLQSVDVNANAVSLELYVDDTLNAGDNQEHLHYRLTGSKSANYRVVINASVDVAQYDITPVAEGGGSTVTVSPAEHGFNGQNHTPGVTVTATGMSPYRTLSPSTDYSVAFYYKGESADGQAATDPTTPNAVGYYEVRVTATDGNYTGTNTGTFHVTPPAASTFTVILQPNSMEYTGSQRQPNVTVMYGSLTLGEGDYAVSYGSNTNVGTGTVTVTGRGNYAALNRVETFPITAKPIAENMVPQQLSSAAFTGSPIVPTFTVHDQERDADLQLGVDYTVEYRRNNSPVGEMVDAGSNYTVVITGRGNYTGSVTRSFTIEAASIGDGDDPADGFTVRVYPSVGVFDGTNHIGSIELVVTHNNRVLTASDYTVTYANQTNPQQSVDTMREVGTYLITVNGRGNYAGSAQTTYQIVAYQEDGLALNIQLTGGPYTYDGTPKRPNVTVTATIGEQQTTLTQADNAEAETGDYWVEYLYNTNAGQATVIVHGIHDYAGRTAVAYFTIGARDIDLATVDAIGPQPFTGDQIRPGVTVRDLSTVLDEGSDYTLDYGPNRDVVNESTTEGSVTIRGQGNYQGTKTVTFDITAADIGGGDGGGDDGQPAEGFTVDVYPASAPYTGLAHEPVVVVHHNGQLMVAERDYTVAYEQVSPDGPALSDGNMINAGTYTIVVTGTGNYRGTVRETYTITEASEGAVWLEIDTIDPATYTGSTVEPELTVYLWTQGADGPESSTLSSYTWSASPSPLRDAGVYIVTVTSTTEGSVGLTASVAFVINPKDLGNDEGGTVSVSVNDSGLTYDGTAKTPTVGVTYTPATGGSLTLNASSDYIPVYSNNIDAGDEAEVTVYGRGNYTGSRTENFTIAKSGTDGGQAGFAVQVYPATGVFTGTDHNPHIQVVDTATGRILSSDEYTLSGHENMREVNTYTITAEAVENSNYQGSATANYQITNAPSSVGQLVVTLVSGQGPFTYNGTQHRPEVTVTYDNRVVTQSGNYEVQYGENINAGTGTVTVNGTGSYRGLSGSVEFQIGQRDIRNAAVQPIEDQVFNGSQLRPIVTVTDSVPDEGTILQLDTDYSVAYGPNNTSGTDAGSVTITGRGNYQGSRTEYFTIRTAGGVDPDNPGEPLPASGSITIQEPIGDQNYTGQPIEPNVTVIWEGQDGSSRTLTRGEHYTLSYSGTHTEPGVVIVTATGIGDYEGLVDQASFNIVTRLTNLTVVVDPQQLRVDAGNPDITVSLNGTELTQDAENGYTLSYSLNGSDAQNMGSAGVYTVTATGTGTYNGAVGTAVFVRLPVDLPGDGDTGDFNVTIPDIMESGNVVTLTYDAADHWQDIVDSLRVQDTTNDPPASLTSPDDYTVTVTYYNNDSGSDTDEMVNAGVYMVTIAGQNDYSGNTSQFAVIINPATIEENDVVLANNGSATYTGTAVTMLDHVTGVGTDSTLNATDHYTLTISGGDLNRINAGTYGVTVVGRGNYTGTVTKSFIIAPAEITITGLSNPEIDFGEDFDFAADLVAGEDYEVNGIVDADVNDVTVTLSAPLIAGEHPITAILGGDKAGNYTVTQDPNFTLTVNPLSMVDPTVPGGGDEDGDGVVDPDKDNDGDGFIEDDNNDGEIVTTNGFRATVNPVSRPFNGLHEDPEVHLYYQPDGEAERELERGTDYTVTYLQGVAGADGTEVAEMIAEGQYTVRISGINNYAGGFDFTYTITPASGGGEDDKDDDEDGNIEDGNNDGEINYQGYRVRLSPTSGYHNSQPHYPRVTVWYTPDGGNEGQLDSSNYTVTYLSRNADGSDGSVVENMVDIGTYTVRVAMNSPYAGTFDLTYTILRTPTGGGGGGGGEGGGGGTSTYAITAEAGTGGVINPSGRVSVNRGSNYTFTITPDEGYRISDVLVDGDSVGAVSRYTFQNVRANHTIEVEFARGSGVADPSETGVATWLNTIDHTAYLSGYPGGLFGPDNNMTRAEVAQMFYGLLLDKDVAITVAFDDVDPNSWYATAVNTLASIGAVSGVGDNMFAPERAITRAEFAVMATRFAYVVTGGVDAFSDVSPDDWFYSYVATCVQYGWISGYPDGTFRPDNSITRAEVTTIVNRMLGRSADSEFVDRHLEELTQFTDVAALHWAYYQIMEATNAHDYAKNGGMESWEQLLH